MTKYKIFIKSIILSFSLLKHGLMYPLSRFMVHLAVNVLMRLAYQRMAKQLAYTDHLRAVITINPLS